MARPTPTAARRRGTSRLGSLRRVLLFKLVVLFFMAHPGSAATFGDVKSFLLSRYPNRDVIPATLLQQQQQQQQQQDRRRTAAATAARSVDSARLLFVRTPGPVPGVAAPQRRTVGAPPPCQVVIGSFVSELERTPEGRRKLAKPPTFPMLQQMHQQFQQSQQQPQLQAAGAAGAQQQAQRQQGSPAVAGAAVGGLLKKSAASFFDAYDGVLSFVGSRVVATEQTLSKALGSVSAIAAATVTTAAAGSSLTGEAASSSSARGSFSKKQQPLLQQPAEEDAPLQSSSSLSQPPVRYDLVGFMDLDPFEKSRRYFKRNSSLTKLLL